MFRPRAEGEGLTLAVRTSPDCQRAIEADDAKLRQVLVNLPGNAVKFTERGSIRLHMWMTERERGTSEHRAFPRQLDRILLDFQLAQHGSMPGRGHIRA